MLFEIVSQFRWWDIIIVILLFRICYISLITGITVELFKLLGTLAAIYLSLHYYISFSNLLLAKVSPIIHVPVETMDFVAFLAVAACGYLFFQLLRSILSSFIKTEVVSNLNKWGGLSLGLIRGVLLAGLLSFALFISSASYLNRSVKNSYLGSRALAVAPAVYAWTWNNFSSKFMAHEKFNSLIDNIQADKARKK